MERSSNADTTTDTISAITTENVGIGRTPIHANTTTANATIWLAVVRRNASTLCAITRIAMLKSEANSTPARTRATPSPRVADGSESGVQLKKATPAEANKQRKMIARLGISPSMNYARSMSIGGSTANSIASTDAGSIDSPKIERPDASAGCRMPGRPARQSLKRGGAPEQMDSTVRLAALTANCPVKSESGSMQQSAALVRTLPMLQLTIASVSAKKR